MPRTHTITISAGDLKGRKLRYPRHGGGGVRPTTARTREAVFDSLGEDVRGAVLVDLYAAAGAVGIEALSRGAAFVHFVERNGEAVACLEDNLAACALDAARYAVHAVDVEAFIAGGGLADPRVRFVYADPPYDVPEGGVETLLALLDQNAYPHVRYLVAEHRGALPERDLRHWEVVRSKRYGDSGVTYLAPIRGEVR